MFERFTERSRDTIQRSRLQARQMGNVWVGTEHVLMALAESPGPVGDVFAEHGLTYASVEQAVLDHVAASNRADRDALAAIGVDLDRVQDVLGGEGEPSPLEMRIERARRWFSRSRPAGGRRPEGALPFTPVAKSALEASLPEALRLKHKAIEPEHLALGVIRHGGGVAGEVLRSRVDVDQLRADLEASALTNA